MCCCLSLFKKVFRLVMSTRDVKGLEEGTLLRTTRHLSRDVHKSCCIGASGESSRSQKRAEFCLTEAWYCFIIKFYFMYIWFIVFCLLLTKCWFWLSSFVLLICWSQQDVLFQNKGVEWFINILLFIVHASVLCLLTGFYLNNCFMFINDSIWISLSLCLKLYW